MVKIVDDAESTKEFNCCPNLINCYLGYAQLCQKFHQNVFKNFSVTLHTNKQTWNKTSVTKIKTTTVKCVSNFGFSRNQMVMVNVDAKFLKINKKNNHYSHITKKDTK